MLTAAGKNEGEFHTACPSNTYDRQTEAKQSQPLKELANRHNNGPIRSDAP